MNREEWAKVQGEKMKAAIEALQKLNTLHDERRIRDSEREPPAGWMPEPTAFGTEATEGLRRAME